MIGADPVAEFRDAIRAAGMCPPDTLEPGRFHRFPGEGKTNGNKAGWCKLFDDARGGIFGDFATGAVETWQAAHSRPLTLAERDAFHRNVAENKARAEAKRRAEHEQAARVASERWAKGVHADATHPYLVAKRVQPHGIKQDGDLLLIPVRDGAELHSLQIIAPDGEKRFLPSGRVAGCYFSIGKPGDTVCVAEGYATGATIHEATGYPVAIAFNAGNVEAVARTLRERLPDARIILCADDDAGTASNPGRTRADEAARAVAGLIAMPDFGENRPDGATDFNDLARYRGAESVRTAVERAHMPDVPERQPSASSATESDPEPRVELVRGSDVVPEAVTWLWKDWIARRKLHILAWPPGTGKTTLALALAATITIGGRWPDGSRATAGDVVIWSGEDGIADTLLPRLLANGADGNRVHFVRDVRDGDGRRPFDPAADTPELALALSRLSASPVLLIVDPIVSAVAGDSHNNAETRRSLQPLVDVGERIGCSIFGISYFSKSTAGRDPVERVTGSVAFGALARVVLAAVKTTTDDGTPGPRLFARAKSNNGPSGGGFHYQLDQVELGSAPGVFASRVLWGDPVEGEAQALLAAADVGPDNDPDARGATDEAVDWLREFLARGAMPAGDAIREARKVGISDKALRRARERLGIVSRKEGMEGGWGWSMPHVPKMPQSPEDVEDAPQIKRGVFDVFGGERAPSANSVVPEDAGEVF